MWKDKNKSARDLLAYDKPVVSMGPFQEYKAESVSQFSPMPDLQLLSLKPGAGLGQGLYALYLADYESESEALKRWEHYLEAIPTLNLFRAFAVSNQGNTAKSSISMIAMPNRTDLSEKTMQDLMNDNCLSLQRHNYFCTQIAFNLSMNSVQDHIETAAQEQYVLTAKAHDLYFDQLEPAAGVYDALERSSSYDQEKTKRFLFEDLKPGPEDDTVAQAAMKAAFEMVRNRYEDAIYQAKINGGKADLSTDNAVALTQAAINSAADHAFESFMRESFGKRDFEGRTYDGLRDYFVAAFGHAAKASMKSVGKRFVHDVTRGGKFKSITIRSEILSDLDEEVAKAFIDTGLAATKNSEYAFLRNLEVSYKIRESSKPEYSLLTLQPLYSSAGKRHNLFAQAAYSHQGGRHGFTGGLGYRYMPESEDYVVGSNFFLDYERPYNHLRGGFGLDLQTSLWGAAANYYKGLSDWKNTTGFLQERAMDGFDVELNGRMPFLPALEVFGRGYRWQGLDGADDIDGTEVRLEYSPVPAFTIEGLVNDESGRDTQYGIGLHYNYTFGAPSDYLYDWQEQFRQKSPSEYIFSKVRRDNKIRVQERIDPAAAGVVPAALLASTPLDGASGLAIGIDVSFTFDQDVQAGVGNIVFTDLTDASNDFVIPVGDARVSIVNDTVTIDLSAQLLDYFSDYEVTFVAGVFEDLSGNATVAMNSGDLNFTTVVDPTAGFPAATVSMAPGGTSGSHENAQDPGTWETIIDIGGAPDGVIFESGATGQGIAASFGGGNLVFAAGDGASTATGPDSIFGTYPIASIAQGLHHFVFVADPDAPSEIGLYIDGIRVITQSIAGNMQGGEWAGTNGAGYGLVNNLIRAGVNSNAISGATLISNLDFYTNVVPASF